MANDRRSPYPGARAYEDFRQKTVQRFANRESDARNHVIGRNQAVARILAYLTLGRTSGAIGAGATVTASGAGYQATRGAAALGQQAAHCLPCTLVIGGRDLSTIAPNPRTTREIRTLFGHVTVLPRAFNAADVAAERVAIGLVAAFLQASEALIRRATQAEGPVPTVFRGVGADHGMIQTRPAFRLERDLVRDVYRSLWMPGARRAYESARAEVSAGRFLAAGDDPTEVAEVLGLYLQVHAIEPSALLDPQLDQIERIFNGVDA